MKVELSDLNPEQRAAVMHDSGPMLVVAGAGTGKTQVITRRIARLIAEDKAEPNEILALTFTEKAAREMAERLYDLVGWRSYQVPVMTFHAFGTELLGRYATHIGRSIGGGLLNDTQKALLLRQHLHEIELSYYGPQSNIFEFLEGVVGYIGKLQNAGITAEQYQRFANEFANSDPKPHAQDVREQHDLAAIFSLYEAVKQRTGTFDYNDQLAIPLQILQQKPHLAERLQKQYLHVLVDEFQDTNGVQDALLRSIVPPHGNIFAVGDDDQAIYEFRGAQIGNILSFQDHYRLKQPIALTTNYRSHQEILDSAYRLIQNNNPERLEAKLGLNKRLVAHKGDGAQVVFTPMDSQADELEAVLEQLRSRLEVGQAPEELAVLSSTKAPLKRLAKLMRAANLPFALAADINIFEQRELVQLWYLLRWLVNEANDEVISHVLLGTFFYWGAEDVRTMAQQARNSQEGLEDVLRASELPQAQAAVKQLDEWRAWARDLRASELGFRLVFETGLSQKLIEMGERSPRIIRVFEDLQRFLSHIQDFESVSLDTSIDSYMEAFPKPPQIESLEPVGEQSGVQLLTVHASKGLEFEEVFLIGCTQRNWSGQQPSSGLVVPEQLQDEHALPPEHAARRLMYVAATRAKRALTLSAAVLDGAGRKQAVTAFIEELMDQTDVQNKRSTDSDGLKKSLQKLQRFYPLKQLDTDRLWFEDREGWIELGVRDLELYDRCHYDFYIEKVLRIQQPFGPQLAFGTAVHGAIQAHYDAQLRGEPSELSMLHARLDELWSNRGYETAAQAAAAKDSARQALADFYSRQQHDPHLVVATELPIRLEIPEAKLRLRGRIDAVLRLEDGVQLRDFKTGRKNDAEKLIDDAKKSFQLRTYALAYEQMTGALPQTVALDYVVTATTGEAELSARILQNHRTKLIQLAAAIRDHDWTPTVSQFHTCPAIRFYGQEGDDESASEVGE